MNAAIDMATAEEQLLATIRAIPPGAVAGYGEVARRAGMPGRARWVARLLSQSGDEGLPWHRVVRADGRIAFPTGSPHFETQCARLRAEGVVVVGGRVRGVRAAPTLDQLLWEPPEDPPGNELPVRRQRARRR